MRPLPALLLAVVVSGANDPLTAQSAGGRDTVEAAGPQYRASGLHRFLLGREYRSLWYTPVTAPILDLDHFAGGLRAVSKGGGQQTKSLLLVAADGREFFFRSIDKDPSATLPLELRGTVAASVVRDQTSSAFPTAPVVVDRLLSSAGIPHSPERLVVLPRAGLGEFGDVFGGLIGFLEDRIGGAEGPAAHWGGAREIIGTDSLFARTARSADDRVDAKALLTARLFDLLIGDWDRHADQWVWARYSDATPKMWRPIPRDRDQAFVKYDGVLLSVARQTAPQLTNFGPNYPYLPGATWNGRDLDRRFLVELEWPDWKAAADELRAKLSDAAIDSAVRALPAEHYTLQGRTLTAALQSRRDHLEEAAEKYYRMLGQQVDVRATESNDDARLVRRSSNTVDLTLRAKDASPSSPPYYARTFTGDVTREIRLFLGGGNDRALVTGSGSGGPRLRILGEQGQDVLVDSTRSGSEKFYDEPGAPSKTEGFAAGVDRRRYAPRISAEKKTPPPRDWGHRWTAATWTSYGPDIGLFIGVGRTLTTYGFRKDPYSTRHRIHAGFATGPTSYRVDYRGNFRRENSRTAFDLMLRASGIDVISFHGFGNETPDPGSNSFYRITQDAFAAAPAVSFGLTQQTTLEVGPFLRYSSTDNRPDRFLATLGSLYGAGKFGEVGAGMDLRFDSRDRTNAPTRGAALDIGGRIVPAIWDVDSIFGEVHGEATTYLGFSAPLDPTLAFRVGGKKLWGRYPFFESAFIGGPSTVRLGRVNRYAGDASAYGSAELRLALARITLVLPARLGIFGLADVGRVFLAGESSNRWHGAAGGGVSLAYLDRAYTFSLAVASGEERTALYLQAGYGF
jgi:Omp85 superfamily domain